MLIKIPKAVLTKRNQQSALIVIQPGICNGDQLGTKFNVGRGMGVMRRRGIEVRISEGLWGGVIKDTAMSPRPSRQILSVDSSAMKNIIYIYRTMRFYKN